MLVMPCYTVFLIYVSQIFTTNNKIVKHMKNKKSITVRALLYAIVAGFFRQIFQDEMNISEINTNVSNNSQECNKRIVTGQT